MKIIVYYKLLAVINPTARRFHEKRGKKGRWWTPAATRASFCRKNKQKTCISKVLDNRIRCCNKLWPATWPTNAIWLVNVFNGYNNHVDPIPRTVENGIYQMRHGISWKKRWLRVLLGSNICTARISGEVEFPWRNGSLHGFEDSDSKSIFQMSCTRRWKAQCSRYDASVSSRPLEKCVRNEISSYCSGKFLSCILDPIFHLFQKS